MKEEADLNCHENDFWDSLFLCFREATEGPITHLHKGYFFHLSNNGGKEYE